MQQWERRLPAIAWGVCLLVAVALGFKQLREPDLWWIIRTGEWVLQHGRVPTQDVFSFTHAGVEWVNVKWGFEVVAYLLARAAGPECIYLLQSLANVLLLVLLARNMRTLRNSIGGEGAGITPGLVLVGLLTLAACDFRSIGRPEMTSHVLSLVVIGLFLRERQRSSRHIWWLVPVLVLWVNMHEAFGVGMVLIAAGVLGLWLDHRMAPQIGGTVQPFPRTALLASGAALLAVVVNPRGPRMWLHPFNIFGQLGENKYTNELFDWRTAHFWRQEETWVVLAFLLAVCMAAVVLPTRFAKRDTRLRATLRAFGTGYLLMLLLFAGLAFTAHRNQPFILWAAAPMVALLIDRLVQRVPLLMCSHRAAFFPLILLGLAFHVAVVTNAFYRVFAPRDAYGLRVDPWKNPVGAAEILRAEGTTGPVFSDPLVSNHLLWALRPDFRSYIDLRDLDVFPSTFFDGFFGMVMDPARFDAEDQVRGFSHAVLYRQQFLPLHAHLANHPQWRMVFADPVAVVYRKEANSGPTDVFQAPPELRASGVARTFSSLLWPPYKDRGEEADLDALAASHYLVVGWSELALQRADQLAARDPVLANDLRGQVFIALAAREAEEAGQLRELDRAEEAYRALLAADPDAVSGHIGMCRVRMYRRDPAGALQHARQAVELDGSNKDALLLAAECHSRMSQAGGAGAQRHVEQWLHFIERAHAVDPDDTLIRIRLGVFLCQRGQCDRVKSLLRGLRGHTSLSAADVQQLVACRKRCGVDDP
ncbi:MAG: hypothetical protein JNM31_09935 [Flavobacteriales bacterium]|nr:hypothetical protein [Flavobacteriales bacterium]